ncbi:ATPase domain protein, prokaryote domain protein [Candidatus Magnetomorum sp. HK-1]|nr:ATPase domain protein, prokaryote domain protein [Candidatus Magnetomorum sp. HK-1]
MNLNKQSNQYPLEEQIGKPDLFVGRIKEQEKLWKWIDDIENKLSKSVVILARKKSGKTALIQRIFNELWNAKGKVIPFYFDVAEKNVWLPNLSVKYFRTFASHFISFIKRDIAAVNNPLTLNQIKEFAKSNNIDALITDVDYILENKGNQGDHDGLWETAYSAPHRYASLYDLRFLVMIDEFQFLSTYVYRDEQCMTARDETIPGSFHYHVESKVAPMLVTGSYVGWKISLIDKYLEASRLSRTRLNPYLTSEEGLKAVYKYSEAYNEPINNVSASLINRLCMSDPFFISCVMKSEYENKDLSTEDGVIQVVNYELTDRNSWMSIIWQEYFDLSLEKINHINAKNILLHLTKHNNRFFTPYEIKKKLKLDLEVQEIHKELIVLAKADMIDRGVSNIDFKGHTDGTMYLMLRNRYEKEIETFAAPDIMHNSPDLTIDFQKEIQLLKMKNKSLKGMLSNISGQLAEYQLAFDFKTRNKFKLSVYFENIKYKKILSIANVSIRSTVRKNVESEMEFDVMANSDCGRLIIVEVKKTKDKIGIKDVRSFFQKTEIYSKRIKEKIIPCYLALGGFTQKALSFCIEKNIGYATEINYVQKEW